MCLYSENCCREGNPRNGQKIGHSKISVLVILNFVGTLQDWDRYHSYLLAFVILMEYYTIRITFIVFRTTNNLLVLIKINKVVLNIVLCHTCPLIQDMCLIRRRKFSTIRVRWNTVSEIYIVNVLVWRSMNFVNMLEMRGDAIVILVFLHIKPRERLNRSV